VQDEHHGVSTLRDYLDIVWRRKWVILQAVVLVPLAAVLLSQRQERLYEASAEVLLSHRNLAASLTGTVESSTLLAPERIAETQAQLARVPAVADQVIRAARLRGITASDFLNTSSVSAKQNADLLTFTVTDASAPLAVKLATEYARQFTKYRSELDIAPLEAARKGVEARIRRLERDGGQRSSLYSSLVSKEQQLRTIEALQTSNVSLVRPARKARQVQPRLLYNGVLGLGLGILLGIGLAFLWEALDTRLRSGAEIAERLRMPLLGRLTEPPRRLRKTNQLAMVAEPDGVHAEGFRILQTNLDLANRERGARSVMVTSAIAGEGKSTVAANLAIALARAGRRVVLVDLDLRRPSLDYLFNLEEWPGLTDVVHGQARLGDALAPIAIAPSDDKGDASSGNGKRLLVGGRLEILPSGSTPHDTGQFVSAPALDVVLHTLRARADLVLIDAPPLLGTADAVALSAKVDALMVVVRLHLMRRSLLSGLAQVVDVCPASKLGFVLAGSGLEARERYRYYPQRPRRPKRERVA
jgi:polysaccharide biosynthesis transport protein